MSPAPIDGNGLPMVKRFGLFEIGLHWITVVAFMVGLGTGLPLAYPRLFWLTNLFGGPTTSVMVHPWAGIAFGIGFAVMFIRWAHAMLPERGDADWWLHLEDYVTLRGRPEEAGRFNGGQKAFFWTMLVATALLTLSGFVVWQEAWAGPFIRSWMRLLHDGGMILAFGLFLVHAYMGSAMYPGTFGSMVHGYVTRGWALLHHARWYRQQHSVR